MGLLRAQLLADPRLLGRLRPRHLTAAAVKTVRLRLEHRHYVRLTSTERAQQLQELGDEVFRRLSDDDDFYRDFDDWAPVEPPDTSA